MDDFQQESQMRLAQPRPPASRKWGMTLVVGAVLLLMVISVVVAIRVLSGPSERKQAAEPSSKPMFSQPSRETTRSAPPPLAERQSGSSLFIPMDRTSEAGGQYPSDSDPDRVVGVASAPPKREQRQEVRREYVEQKAPLKLKGLGMRAGDRTRSFGGGSSYGGSSGSGPTSSGGNSSKRALPALQPFSGGNVRAGIGEARASGGSPSGSRRKRATAGSSAGGSQQGSSGSPMIDRYAQEVKGGPPSSVTREELKANWILMEDGRWFHLTGGAGLTQGTSKSKSKSKSTSGGKLPSGSSSKSKGGAKSAVSSGGGGGAGLPQTTGNLCVAGQPGSCDGQRR